MKIKTLVLCIIATTACLAASAQVKTSFGDDVSTLDGVMKAYYEVVTVKKGGKISFERDSLLHIANAGVGVIQINENRRPQLHYITLRQYHNYADASLEKNGFDEREIHRQVEHFGAVYHVWSTYESRVVADGPVTDRGINSIELYFDGQRFWITSWIFDAERKGIEIPKEYLGK